MPAVDWTEQKRVRMPAVLFRIIGHHPVYSASTHLSITIPARDAKALEYQRIKQYGDVPIGAIMSFRREMCLILCIAAIAGCAFSVDKFSSEAQFDRAIIPGIAYRHVLYSRQGADESQRLHVYIEGDGTPWKDGIEPSSDPTPSNPLALRLMALDPADVAFIGRPCYFGLINDAGCVHETWTSGRYSESVVASMAAAIRHVMSDNAHDEAIIIGYSGGGTLARLVASLVPGVTGVLTVNANLDIDAWTELNAYLSLRDSINPAKAHPLPAAILHVQAIGDKDVVVRPEITEQYRKSGQSIEVWRFPDFGHVCCWLEAWPDILISFQVALANRTASVEQLPVYD
jgi:hypothetical protein